MKILYIYLTDIRKTWANIVQTLQMCEALSKLHKVSFFHPFLLKTTLDERLSFFHVEKGFHIIRLVAFGPLKKKYLDFANRIDYIKVKSYYPSLYLNVGISYEESGNYPEAKKYYDLACEKILDLPTDKENEKYSAGVKKAIFERREKLDKQPE